jgi:alanine dehydrogenase
MLVISAEDVERALPWDSLIGSLASMFRDGCEAPVRHHHKFERPRE